MTPEEFQNQWQESNQSATRQPVDVDAMLRTWRRVEKNNFGVLRRDLVETVAAIAVVLLFGRGIFTLDPWVAKSGAAICVLGAVFVIYKLNRTRMVCGESRLDLTVQEFYERETDRIKKQIHLLRTMASWYLMPFFIGMNLVFAGNSDSLVSSLAYFVFTLLFCWGIYALNQREVSKKFVPLFEELEVMQKDLAK